MTVVPFNAPAPPRGAKKARTRLDGSPWGSKWHQESWVLVDHVRALYRQGLSSRQVAAATNCSKSYVARLCADIQRSKSEAALLRPILTRSTKWRAARNAARSVVERSLGYKLTSNMVVHHKDEDYTNNSLDNLQVMTRGDHNRLHMRLRMERASR